MLHPKLVAVTGALALLVNSFAFAKSEDIGIAAIAIDVQLNGSAFEVNDTLNEGDALITGKEGTVTILFNDESMLTLGPNAHASIETYVEAENGKPGNSVVRVHSGQFRYFPGGILENGGSQFVAIAEKFYGDTSSPISSLSPANAPAVSSEQNTEQTGASLASKRGFPAASADKSSSESKKPINFATNTEKDNETVSDEAQLTGSSFQTASSGEASQDGGTTGGVHLTDRSQEYTFEENDTETTSSKENEDDIIVANNGDSQEQGAHSGVHQNTRAETADPVQVEQKQLKDNLDIHKVYQVEKEGPAEVEKEDDGNKATVNRFASTPSKFLSRGVQGVYNPGKKKPQLVGSAGVYIPVSSKAHNNKAGTAVKQVGQISSTGSSVKTASNLKLEKTPKNLKGVNVNVDIEAIDTIEFENASTLALDTRPLQLAPGPGTFEPPIPGDTTPGPGETDPIVPSTPTPGVGSSGPPVPGGG